MLYKAYGLCIYSDFNLPFLDIASKFKTPEVSLEIDQSLVAPLEYKCTNYFTKTSQDSVVYIRKGIGLFFVKKDSIKIKPDCASLDEDFARVLLGLPFGYLLMLRSQLTFHASAVSKNNKGVIFIGKSGIGKSTIAYELLLKGFKFIAEDICSTSKLKLINSFPMLKLSDDHFTKEIDFFKKDRFSFPTDSLNRKGFILKDWCLEKKLILSSTAYILLEKDISDVEIKSLSLNESIKYLHENTFKTHPIKNDLLLKKNFQRLVEFSSNIKTYAVISSKSNFINRNIKLYDHLSERI